MAGRNGARRAFEEIGLSAALYNPPAFAETDQDRIAALIDGPRAAILVTVGADGPYASHLPLLRDQGRNVLEGHLAKPNPQWRGTDPGIPALAIFTGPDAYVSPRFYPSKAEHGRVVPTWNYLTVHVRGRISFSEDPADLRAIVDRLTRRHEADAAKPWNVADAPPAFTAGQLKGIVAVRLAIQTIEAKSKLSQNRTAADRAGVVAGLERSDDPVAAEVALAMRGRRA